jgi:hypothetical protein
MTDEMAAEARAGNTKEAAGLPMRGCAVTTTSREMRHTTMRTDNVFFKYIRYIEGDRGC